MVYRAHSADAAKKKQTCDQKLVSRSASAHQGQNSEGKVLITRSQNKQLKKRRAETEAAPDQQPCISTSSEVDTTVDKDFHNLKRRRDDKQKKQGPHSSDKEFSKLAVIIHRGDGVSLDEIDATILRKRLTDHIQAAVQAKVDGRKLAFAASRLVLQGFFLVIPMTEEARCWILSLDFGCIKETPLILSPLPREKVAIWLPGREDEIPKEPLKLLVGQNAYKEHLRVEEWFLTHRESFPTGTRLVVGVPPKLIKGQVWLNFQATQVVARLIKSSSKVKTPNKEIEIDSSEYNTEQPTSNNGQTMDSNAAPDGSTDTELSSHSNQYQHVTITTTIVKEELHDEFDIGENDHQTGSSNAGPEGRTDTEFYS